MNGEKNLSPPKSDYDKICDFDSLYRAHLQARKGKRHKQEVIQFEMKLAENLTKISTALKNRTYQMKGYYHFTIFEPKRREIYAGHYQDRVVLHCICDEVLNPVLWSRLIYDNVACQKNKGTHFAINRFTLFLREHYRKYGNSGYVLKCDVQKYFANIDQAILKKELAKVIKDVDLQKLLSHYIDSYETPNRPGKGLPLGNQSSQTFAVFYLNRLDRVVKEELRVKYYVRYMDDWLLLHHDRQYLQHCLQRIKETVENDLKLTLNEKTQIFSLKEGIEFLGWRFYLTDTGKVIRKIKRQSKTRFKRRIRKLNADYEAGLITDEEVRSCKASYEGHLKHGNTYHLRNKVLGNAKKEQKI